MSLTFSSAATLLAESSIGQLDNKKVCDLINFGINTPTDMYIREDGNYVDAAECFAQKFSQNRLSILFSCVSQCTCCDRHVNYRPARIDSIENSFRSDVAAKFNCKCLCRQMMRHLRRAHFEKAGLGDLRDEMDESELNAANARNIEVL